jgi:hypothetical protein
MKFGFREKSDSVDREDGGRNSAGEAPERTALRVGRVASSHTLACDGHCTSQSLASLGVHVDSFVRDLHQFEMVDVVESERTRDACRMALCGISSRLARDGRR